MYVLEDVAYILFLSKFVIFRGSFRPSEQTEYFLCLFGT
jgi:hypothetical protein